MDKDKLYRAIEEQMDTLFDLKDDVTSLINRAKEAGFDLMAQDLEDAYDSIRSAIRAYSRASK